MFFSFVAYSISLAVAALNSDFPSGLFEDTPH